MCRQNEYLDVFFIQKALTPTEVPEITIGDGDDEDANAKAFYNRGCHLWSDDEEDAHYSPWI